MVYYCFWHHIKPIVHRTQSTHTLTYALIWKDAEEMGKIVPQYVIQTVSSHTTPETKLMISYIISSQTQPLRAMPSKDLRLSLPWWSRLRTLTGVTTQNLAMLRKWQEGSMIDLESEKLGAMTGFCSFLQWMTDRCISRTEQQLRHTFLRLPSTEFFKILRVISGHRVMTRQF